MVEADLSSQQTYSEIVYPLSSVVDTPTITNLARTPAAYSYWMVYVLTENPRVNCITAFLITVELQHGGDLHRRYHPE